MQPLRARTKRPWKDNLRDTRKTRRSTEDPLWLDACNKLEENLNVDKERDAIEASSTLRSHVGAPSTISLHQAEDANRGNEDGKALLIARLRQTGIGSGIRAGKFLAVGSSHQAHKQGYDCTTGTLQANTTSHSDVAGNILPSTPLCQAHHEEGHDASAGSAPYISPLWQAQENNGHDAKTKEHTAIMVQCQSQNKNDYGVANSWTLLSQEEPLHASEKGAHPYPSFDDAACLLHKSISSRCQQHALGLHAHGLDSHGAVGNHMVSMLAEAGCMHDAQQSVDKLVYQNNWSWDSLITSYIKKGELCYALSLYQKFSKDKSFCCSRSTFALLLKACAQLKDLKTGTELHAKVAKLGLHLRDAFIANSLVDMYAKCGSFAQGRSLLERLCIRDVIGWTALITGYANHGLVEEAFGCFKTMQLKGVVPDRVIFICILRACGSIRTVDRVLEIHIEIERIGLVEKDVAFGTILIEIYASCNLLSRAQQLFDKLHNRDVISWTALILGYSEHGHSKEALKYFNQMQHEGVVPDAITLMCILKACSSLGALNMIQKIHVQIETAELLARNDIAGSVLVDVYGKCGALDKALQVFHQLHVRGVIPWTALIEGYAEHGHGEEALKCFKQMQMEGVLPNAVTFSCSLKACSSIGASIEGQKIHFQVERRGLLEKNLIVGNALVDMYTKCGLLDKAQRVFDKLPLRNVVSWTSLIAGYAEHGRCETALKCFDQMRLEGVSPNAITFTFCLKACGSIGAIDKGGEIHAQIESEGLLERDAVVGNSLVDMYARFGMFAKAQQVFDKLPNQTVVSWTSLIARFAEHGHAEEALDCFEQMQHKCIYPNDVTFVTILKVCGGIGAIDKVQELHSEIVRLGLLDSKLVGNTLVFIYSKCGLLALAKEVFEKLPVRDVASWNSLIAGYNQLGDTEHALSIFDRMQREGVRPGSMTFTIVLSACNRQGLLNESQMYFQALHEDYGISLAPEHQVGMLDTFCRAGEFDKAKAIMQAMDHDSNVVMWHSLLGACKSFQNVDFGKWAFGHALHLDEKDAASYALMSQVYGVSSTQGKKCLQIEKTNMEENLL